MRHCVQWLALRGNISLHKVQQSLLDERVGFVSKVSDQPHLLLWKAFHRHAALQPNWIDCLDYRKPKARRAGMCRLSTAPAKVPFGFHSPRETKIPPLLYLDGKDTTARILK
jgi:hypothetical protein